MGTTREESRSCTCGCAHHETFLMNHAQVRCSLDMTCNGYAMSTKICTACCLQFDTCIHTLIHSGKE